MLLEIPFPKGLTAHNTGHWRGKSKAVADVRLIAKCIALDALARGQEAVKGRHVIHYRFVVPDNIRRDRVNMMQTCKPIIDGLVDAGVIEGDHWQISEVGRVTVEVEKKRNVVIFEILPAE